MENDPAPVQLLSAAGDGVVKITSFGSEYRCIDYLHSSPSVPEDPWPSFRVSFGSSGGGTSRE